MSRHVSPQPDRRRVLVGVAFVALVIVSVGVVLGLRLGDAPESAPGAAGPPPTSQAPPPSSSPAPKVPVASGELSESFAQFQRQTFGEEVAGLVVQAIGQAPVTVAPWNGETTAWSTIKVPLAIAALDEGLGEQLDADITAALTVSDNDAAERIWAALGSGDAAAAKVEAVLDDPATTVQAERIRPPYTPFGQTRWQLEDQVGFLSRIACAGDESAQQVLTLMGRVSADTWGLGRIEGTKFKGGWGPGAQSGYLVRQFGVLADASGAPATVVALIVEPGSFDEGTSESNSIAQWLTDNRALLPVGHCAPATPGA